MRNLGICLPTAVALFGHSALQPGGLANRNRGFVKPLKFALYFRSVQPATISVEEEGQALTRVERTPQGKARHRPLPRPPRRRRCRCAPVIALYSAWA